MGQHTGEKPYKCHFCPYRTVSTFNLKQHSFVHFPEERFVCFICRYKARQFSTFKNHMLKAHQVSKEEIYSRRKKFARHLKALFPRRMVGRPFAFLKFLLYCTF